MCSSDLYFTKQILIKAKKCRQEPKDTVDRTSLSISYDSFAKDVTNIPDKTNRDSKFEEIKEFLGFAVNTDEIGRAHV